MARKTTHINVKQPVFPFGREYLPDNSQPVGDARIPNSEGKLLAMDIRNILPTEYGLTSFFGKALMDINIPITTEYVLLYRSDVGNNILIALGIFGAQFTVDGITWDKTQSPVVDRDVLDSYTSGTLTIPSLSATVNPATTVIDANANVSGVTGQVNAVITITDKYGNVTTQQLALNIHPVTYIITAVDTSNISTQVGATYSLSGITPEGTEEIIGVANTTGTGIITYTIVGAAVKTWLDDRGIINYNPWSFANVSNTFYCYRQGLGHILSINTLVTPEVWVVNAPTFLNLPTIVGIFSARSRLGAWDTTNSIFTSSPLNALDFIPSLKTQANSVKVDSVVGRIITVLPITNGFIIYATSGIVLAQYLPTSRVAVFSYKPLSKSEGIAHRHAAIEAGAGVHYAHTGSGLHRVTTQGLTPISVELDSYIASSIVSPRLEWVQGRYVAINITPSKASGTLQYKSVPGVPITPFDPGTPINPAPVPAIPPTFYPPYVPPTLPEICPTVTDKIIQVSWQLLSLAPEQLEPGNAAFGIDVSTNKGALTWYGMSGLGDINTSNKLLLGVTTVTQWIRLSALPLVMALQVFINKTTIDNAHKYINARGFSGDIFGNVKSYENAHPATMPWHTVPSGGPPGVNVNHVDYNGIFGTITNILLMDFDAGQDYADKNGALFNGSLGSIFGTAGITESIPMASGLPPDLFCRTTTFDYASLAITDAEATAITGLLGIGALGGADTAAPVTSSYLVSTGSTEPITPVYTRGIILDTQLKNWGSYDDYHRLLIDYSPLNFRSFNPITGLTAGKFTFQNLARTFVIGSSSGELFLATQTHTDSFVEFGNLSFTRTGVTRMLDALVELATFTGATFEIKDAKGAIIASSVQEAAGELAIYKVLTSKWFSLIVRGEFTLKGMDFSGEKGGNR